jgi:MFS family permease
VLGDFAAHSLIPAVSIAASILSGVLKLPIAKVIDTWGRPQGFALMTLIATMGMVMMAACTNVETYAAAQVFYSVGTSGFLYVLDVIIADTSSLRNRALAYAFASSPYIATTFAGPAMAEKFLENSSWQWAFGTFAILTPVVAAPVMVILLTNAKKAKNFGVMQRQPSGRTALQSVWHYIIEFDGEFASDMDM